MKDRNEKIKFLKELAKGKRSISELLPVPPERIFIEQEDPDLYLCHETGKMMTREDIGKRFTRGMLLIVRRDERTERVPFPGVGSRIFVFVSNIETAIEIKNIRR